MNNTIASDANAYIDEAGSKGLLRKLDPNNDGEIALIASIAVQFDRFEEFHGAFREPFERFEQARPVGGGKLHITDAFKPGNETWAVIAEEVRNQIFELIEDMQIPVVYEARRLGIARKSFQTFERALDAAYASRQSPIKMSRRPSNERIEEECMIGLVLKLDALMQDLNLGTVDLMTDQLDSQIAKLFSAMIERTQTVSQPSESTVKGFDLVKQEIVEGTIRIEVKDALGELRTDLDARHIGELTVLGKDDPLIFAADVVANALFYHLSSLQFDEPLNHPGSIKNWVLGNRVYGVREGAIENGI